VARLAVNVATIAYQCIHRRIVNHTQQLVARANTDQLTSATKAVSVQDPSTSCFIRTQGLSRRSSSGAMSMHALMPIQVCRSKSAVQAITVQSCLLPPELPKVSSRRHRQSCLSSETQNASHPPHTQASQTWTQDRRIACCEQVLQAGSAPTKVLPPVVHSMQTYGAGVMYALEAYTHASALTACVDIYEHTIPLLKEA
jgi:hypothetical protein